MEFDAASVLRKRGPAAPCPSTWLRVRPCARDRPTLIVSCCASVTPSGPSCCERGDLFLESAQGDFRPPPLPLVTEDASVFRAKIPD